MKDKIDVIDIEPKWITLIPMLLDMVKTGKRDIALKELNKIAKIADLVRAAQKNGVPIIFNVDGSYKMGE